MNNWCLKTDSKLTHYCTIKCSCKDYINYDNYKINKYIKLSITIIIINYE